MDIAQILRSEGFKVTPQRIAIYDALRGHHNHPTAEMIYHSLRPTHPSMSLATVYKTMEIFEKIGLVKVLEVGDERAHYDWDTTAHAHIRCVRCNKVEDMKLQDSKLHSKAYAQNVLKKKVTNRCPLRILMQGVFESYRVERIYNVYNRSSFIYIKRIFTYGKGSH